MSLIFRIIYPEITTVTEDKIASWYKDAVANDQVERDERDFTNVVDQARALDRVGLITLHSIL